MAETYGWHDLSDQDLALLEPRLPGQPGQLVQSSSKNDAPIVESKLIDEDGDVSCVFRAYSFLEMHENTLDLFEKLYETSLAAGKTYALMYFYIYNKKAYEKAKESIRKDEIVEIKIADILRRFSMQEIVDKIEDNTLYPRLEMKKLRK
ncbi:MAG: hypothetical protein LBU45_08105 [Azoarcus sp.]|jgi:hypothetical protein|nr:hypothetical protein [Azoarcus sp.]